MESGIAFETQFIQTSIESIERSWKSIKTGIQGLTIQELRWGRGHKPDSLSIADVVLAATSSIEAVLGGFQRATGHGSERPPLIGGMDSSLQFEAYLWAVDTTVGDLKSVLTNADLSCLSKRIQTAGGERSLLEAIMETASRLAEYEGTTTQLVRVLPTQSGEQSKVPSRLAFDMLSEYAYMLAKFGSDAPEVRAFFETNKNVPMFAENARALETLQREDDEWN